MRTKLWDINLASKFCKKLESVAPLHGFHVALTGGTLYKEGNRKDCDVIVYRIRDQDGPSTTDIEKLWEAFEELEVTILKDFGFVTKAQYNGLDVDFLFPECENNREYLAYRAEE